MLSRSMNKNLQSSTAQFIEKAIKINGIKFNYSKVEYVGSHTKVCIICPEHGEFYQSPTNHLSGNGCLKCTWKYKRGKYRLTTLIDESGDLNLNDTYFPKSFISLTFGESAFDLYEILYGTLDYNKFESNKKLLNYCLNQMTA